jgi:hypothetical protein
VRPPEYYIEHADDLAAFIISEGAKILQNQKPEFGELFDKAERYRTAKRTADNHREFGMLTSQEAAEEEATRLEFAKAYKAFEDKDERKAASGFAG